MDTTGLEDSMEPKAGVNEKFFIVTRGKSRKGFSRGCIGRAETETPHGEVIGLLYGGRNRTGSPKSGGAVRKEDTYSLNRHQAQLLLFVLPTSSRIDLLCKPQLFSAICQLSQGDLVVVRYKKALWPGQVKNVMQVGRNENPDDLHMICFEVEFVDSDESVCSKKHNQKHNHLPLFSAADIVQVGPQSATLGTHWKDGVHVPDRKAGPNVGAGPCWTNGGLESPAHPPGPLEVGSLVEVVSDMGVSVYGVIRWIGIPAGRSHTWAGVELDYEICGCSDGKYGGKRYFSCKDGMALFVPVTKCSPDSRFLSSPAADETLWVTEVEPPVPSEESEEEEDAPPIPESKALSLLVGRMKGIQGHFNSCYLDATLFSLFSSSVALDRICPAPPEQSLSRTLRKDIVNRLRRQGFVPAQSVMKLRKQLGCDSYLTEEKDPEEFITILMKSVLCMEPLLKLRSGGESAPGAYTFQVILDREQVAQVPSVQQLLDASFMSCDLKFEEIPHCLIVQMPRFGKKFKMFPHIIPSTELDITDLLHNAPRECFICGRLAEHECLQCLPDRRLQPGQIKQYCGTCNTQVHMHPSRQDHHPAKLSTDRCADGPLPRHTLQLFAVLCIQTSHYVSFVKYGTDPRCWLFFDSMADRCGDDQNGYNVPEITACPELGDLLSCSEEQARADPSQAAEPVRRLLCDSYMFLYQNTAAQASASYC